MVTNNKKKKTAVKNKAALTDNRYNPAINKNLSGGHHARPFFSWEGL